MSLSLFSFIARVKHNLLSFCRISLNLMLSPVDFKKVSPRPVDFLGLGAMFKGKLARS